MASITIRQLDDDLKKRLRLRAARNGRSMEEEARIILGHAAAGRDGGATKRSAPRQHRGRAACSRSPMPEPRSRQQARAPDHRRRHRRLQIARSDPAAEGARARRALHPHRSGAGIHHAALRRRALGRAGVHGLVRRHDRARRRPHPAGARGRSRGGGAGDRRPYGQDGGRARLRSRGGGVAGDRPAGAAGAGDEPADVGASGNPAQPGAAPGRRHRRDRTECAARWPRAARPASAAWPSRSRSWRPRCRCSTTPVATSRSPANA